VNHLDGPLQGRLLDLLVMHQDDSLGQAPSVTHKHYASLLRFAKDKHSSLSGPFVNYEKKVL
jgi:hypothetical protein